MKKTLRLVGFGILLWTLRPGDAWSALVVDAAAVTPASSPVGVATSVTVTARINEPSVLADGVNLQRLDGAGRVLGVLGLLHDDGANGDAAGDKTFSLRLTVFETAPGPLRLRVSAAFRGSITRAFSAVLTVNITGSTATGITILSPADLAYLNTSPITVSGTVGDAGAGVTINGVPASASGGTFQASVPLVEGTNTLTAVATNTGGTTSTANVQVTLDTTPPHLTIESPADNLGTTDAAVTVAGTVNDIVVGTVNTQQAQVTVNGVAAQVANRSFLAANIPLTLGLNTIQAIGQDRSGNSVTTTVHVTRLPPTSPFVRVVSGNNQSGPVSGVLPTALVVALDNGHGQPVANTPVVFKVTDNNGIVTGGGSAAASVAVATDAQGRAQVSWRLGSRAGAGSNRVDASVTGFGGTASFTATGVPAGAASITVDSGNNQIGALKEKLAFPFVVVVTDAGFNRLGGVPVTFTVKQGGGTIGTQAVLTMNTDPDGRAAAVLALGAEPGFDNNVVEASFPGNPGQAAVFVATAKAPGNAADTRISGVVLDNSNNPIAGVTVRLFKTNQGNNNNTPVPVGTPVTTSAQGQFLMTSAPVGFFKLMADGTTVDSARGVFPTLEYDLVTVAGQDNTVGMALLLPKLDIVNKLCVNETTGGTLTLPEVPGFSLTVAAGSATFPGGARSGCVTVSTVNADKSPMTPGFGQQPRFLITIQPVGTTFNPPAPITMPNIDGLQPGQITELYSYDHDLSAFTAIGTGTVSADGLLVRSDPGVGILKAGWHCGGNPNQTGSAASLAVTLTGPASATAGSTVNVTANGTPPLDGTYTNWQVIDDPADPDDDPAVATFVTTPACPGAGSCTAQLKGTRIGIVSIRVTFVCTTTGATVTSSIVKVKFTLGLTPKEVSFLNDIDIFKDQIGSTPKINDPVWKDTNAANQNEPVGYPSAATMTVTVKFAVNPVPASAVTNVTIEGEIPGLGKFRKTGVTIPAAAEVTVTGIVADTALPATQTKFYNPMTINWRHMADGKTCPNCTDDGPTANKVYVTLAAPTVATVYLTSLNLAVANDGATTPAQAIAKSWSFFGTGSAPSDVKGWDGRALIYYPAGIGFLGCATDVVGLLTSATGGGRCGAFALFMKDVLAVNGVSSNIVVVDPTEDDGFLVKNWTFSGTPSFPAAAQYKWSFAATGAFPNEMVPAPVGGLYGDMTSAAGVPGENSPTPSEKAHLNHGIVLVGGVYYNPSYGLTYTGAADFETKALDGYFKQVAGDPANVSRVRKSPGLIKVMFTTIP